MLGFRVDPDRETLDKTLDEIKSLHQVAPDHSIAKQKNTPESPVEYKPRK